MSVDFTKLRLPSGDYEWISIEGFTIEKIEELIRETERFREKIKRQLETADSVLTSPDTKKNIDPDWYKRAQGKVRVLSAAKKKLCLIRNKKYTKENKYYHFYIIAQKYLPKKMLEDIKYLMREDMRKWVNTQFSDK